MHFGGVNRIFMLLIFTLLLLKILLMPRLHDLIPILKSRRRCVHVLHKHIQAIVSLCYPMQN